jgi:hypothetical protein
MDEYERRLRFLNASHVETPAGHLSNIVIVGESDRALGKLDGIIFDPIERQVRYFVIRSRRWWRVHRYLLAAEPLRVEWERKVLRLISKSGNLDQLPEITPGTFSPYSDEDRVDAVFSTHAA